MLRGGGTAARRCAMGILTSPRRRGRLLGDFALSALNNGALQESLARGSIAGLARRLVAGLSRNGENAGENGVHSEINTFQRGVPVEEAVTPPSSWYTSPEILSLELEKVFERRWLAVGRVEQLQRPGDFFTGKVGRVRYVVCMDEKGTVRAFHNICRHHGAPFATGSGCAASFVCPYHGWTYGLDGRLVKALRLGGIKNFSAKDNGLIPLRASTWGPFVLISCLPSEQANNNTTTPKTHTVVEKEWLGSAGNALVDAKIADSFRHITTREYTLNCNWKVFCDNGLDGGYHVPYAHTKLASYLNMKSYRTTLSEKVSIQSCRAAGKGDERVGESATYAFVYPNFLINRYGPWMDTNLVLPITATQCRVIFDYFLESSYAHDESFIKESLHCSDVVQQEDIALCEAVQDGLQSPAYDVGRYAPNVEHAMHHFHTLLHEDLSGDSEAFDGLEPEELQQASAV